VGGTSACEPSPRRVCKLSASGGDQRVEVGVTRLAFEHVDDVRIRLQMQRPAVPETTRGSGNGEPGVMAG
jgi:hypothetical protein